MIAWIEKPLLRRIHQRQAAEHGGDAGVRDEHLLDWVLERPRHLHAHGEPPADLAALAACLAYRLARNRPFIDGNARTAAAACETFLGLNGAGLQADDLQLYPRYLALAGGTLEEADFAAWLRRHLVAHGAAQPAPAAR